MFPLIAMVILLAVLVPQHFASAICPVDITDCLTSLNSFMLTFLGSAIGWAAGLLNSFIQLQTDGTVFGVKVIEDSWTIIRNFVNLFFILVLIIMAFGTIFDIKKYTWKEMLAPFLIAALLINFSLAIGQYIITISNGLARVFLNEIVRSGGVSETFATGSSIVKLAAGGEADLLTGVSQVAMTGIFSLVFLAIVFLALFSAFIFSIARLFVLWFLLIISPIAWFGYALPNLRQKTWNSWWDNFLCWCFFLPYYLFFMMFAVIFINAKDSFPPIAGGNFPGIQMLGNDLMVYGISLVFLVGGLGIARKLACASGSYVGKTFGAIETGVRKYAPGAAYVRGGVAGLKERGAELQEKGVLGIGGAQRARLQEATAKGWVAGAPGPGQVPGAREERSRAESAEVDKEVKRLQTLNLTLDQLNEKLKTAKGPEKIAAFKLKFENGWAEAADADELAKQVKAAGGGRTALGASLIASAKKGKFQKMALGTKDKEDMFNKFLGEDLELAKAFGLDMAESRELMNADTAKKLLDIYGSDTREVKDKVEKVVKDNIKNIARKGTDRKDLLNNTGAFVGTDDRLRKLAGQVMIEEKEVGDWQTRNKILELNGGIDPSTDRARTAEGRGFEKDMADGNVAINEEAKYRRDNGISTTAPLTVPQYTALEGEVVANVKSGLIRSLNTEDLKSTVIFNALYNGYTTGTLTADEFNKAVGLTAPKRRRGAPAVIGTEIKGKPDRKKREAINELVNAVTARTGPKTYP